MTCPAGVAQGGGGEAEPQCRPAQIVGDGVAASAKTIGHCWHPQGRPHIQRMPTYLTLPDLAPRSNARQRAARS